MKKMIFILGVGVFVLFAVALQAQAYAPVEDSHASGKSQSEVNGDGVYWIASYGGALDDSIHSVDLTSDGGFVVAGASASFGVGGMDMWILKINADGSVQWQKTYGGAGDDRALFVGQTSDGGFFVVGITFSFRSDGYDDLWILKLNPDGSSAWQKLLPKLYLYSSFQTAVHVTSNGDLVVGGNFLNEVDNFYVLLRIRPDGTILWQKSYEWGPTSIQETIDGGFIAGSGNLLRLDANGDIVWIKNYGYPYYVTLAKQTQDGGFIIGGSSQYAQAVYWLARVDTFGNILWEKSYQDNDNDIKGEPHAIEETQEGDFIVSTTTQFLMKLDANGSVLWQNKYRSVYHRHLLNEIKVLPAGDILAVGHTHSFDREDNGLIFKLASDGKIEPCNLIENWHQTFDPIALQQSSPTNNLLTNTLTISTTLISPLETGVKPAYWCQNGVNIPPEFNEIFTFAGSSGTLVVSLNDLSANLPNTPQYSLDGGINWLWAYPFPQNFPFLVGIVPRDNPEYPLRLLAKDYYGNIVRSGDWGTTWVSAVVSDGPLVVSPLNPQLMYTTYASAGDCWIVCIDTGYIYWSVDGGVTWETHSETYGEVYSQVILSPVNELDGFFAVDDYFTGMRTWRHLGSTTDLTFPVDHIALDAVDPNRIFGVTANFASGQTSPDGGQTWIPWASAPPAACIQLMAHPAKHNTLYLRCASGLFRSTNGGDSWTQITTIQGDTLAPHLGIPGQILWSHTGCLLTSNDDGDGWQTMNCFNSFPYRKFLPMLNND